ncbi:MAG: OmpH family outer membrane protein [Bacteroidetes bacterium]|nr:OmpH family outer membrane protein [Bacteroidota bacterium]
MSSKLTSQKLLILVIILTGISLFISLFLLISNSSNSKIGYVKIEQVYEEFDLKKQLSSQLSSLQIKRKNEMDSLGLKIKMLESQLKNQNKPSESEVTFYKQLLDEYEIRSDQYNEEETRISSTFNEQIVNQINRYIKEYAIMNNYSIIHGTDGNGNIMYAEEDLDVTNKVIQYINKKHAGFN